MKYRIMVLFCWVVLVSDAAAVQTQYWKYELKESHFIPGYTSRLIRSRMLVGSAENLDVPSSSDTKVSIQDRFRLAGKSMKSQIQSITEELRKFSVITERPRSSVTSTTEVSESKAPASRVGADSDSSLIYDWGRFFRCVQTSVPRLKKMLSLEARLPFTQGDERMLLEPELSQLREEIQSERGNGRQTEFGVVCGKYLGGAGFVLQNHLEEVKFLVAIAARDGEESKFLLKSAVAAFHSDIPQAVSQIWATYWKILSLKAVFSTSSLPTVEELKAELTRGMRLQFGIKEGVSFQVNGLDHVTATGLELAEGLMR